MSRRTNESGLTELVMIIGIVVIGMIAFNALGGRDWVESKYRRTN
jgi:hypothetical protein